MFGWPKKNPSLPKTPHIAAALELVGWCSAEALLNLSTKFESKLAPGDAALLPMLAISSPSGKRHCTVFDSVTPETFENVKKLLDQLSPSDKSAVLSHDGYVTVDGKRRDAVVLEGHLLCQPRQSICIALPYQHWDDQRPFTFGHATIISHDGFDVDAVDVSSAIVRGRESHPKAKEIWDAHFRVGE